MKKFFFIMLLFTTIIVLGFQIDPMNDAEIIITPQNTKVIKQMGKTNKPNTKIYRRLSVILDGIEIKGNVIPGHTERTLLMIRTEDSPLVMITRQIDNTVGDFSVSFSGALDSCINGTGGNGVGARGAFLGEAIGKISCKEYRIDFKAGEMLILDSKYSDFPFSCPVDDKNTLTSLKDEATISGVNPKDFSYVYGLMFLSPCYDIASGSTMYKCMVCKADAIFIKIEINYTVLPEIIVMNWQEQKLAGSIASKYWNDWYNETREHEIAHYRYFADFSNIFTVVLNIYCCKNSNKKAYDKIIQIINNQAALQKTFKPEQDAILKQNEDFLKQIDMEII